MEKASGTLSCRRREDTMSFLTDARKALTTVVYYFTSIVMCDKEYPDRCKEMDEDLYAIRCGGLLYIRFLVMQRRYVLSSKAYKLHAGGYYELEDLESSICFGSVQKTQKDEQAESVGNKKYVIVGPDTHGYDFYSVGKIKVSADGRTYYVITAHPMKRG